MSNLIYTKVTDTLYNILFKKLSLGVLVMLEDGQFYWMYNEFNKGSYSAWVLEDICKKLKELNKPLEDQLNNNVLKIYEKQNYKVFPQKYENSERYLREGDVCRTLDADESNYGEAIYEIYIWIDHINAYMWIDVDDFIQMLLTKDDPKIIEEEFGDMFGEYMSYTISTHMENRKYLGHITGELIKEKLDPVVYIHVLTLFKHQQFNLPCSKTN